MKAASCDEHVIDSGDKVVYHVLSLEPSAPFVRFLVDRISAKGVDRQSAEIGNRSE